MTELFSTEAEEIMALCLDVQSQCERSACEISKGCKNIYYYFDDQSVIILNHKTKEFKAD